MILQDRAIIIQESLVSKSETCYLQGMLLSLGVKGSEED